MLSGKLKDATVTASSRRTSEAGPLVCWHAAVASATANTSTTFRRAPIAAKRRPCGGRPRVRGRAEAAVARWPAEVRHGDRDRSEPRRQASPQARSRGHRGPGQQAAEEALREGAPPAPGGAGEDGGLGVRRGRPD